MQPNETNDQTNTSPEVIPAETTKVDAPMAPAAGDPVAPTMVPAAPAEKKFPVKLLAIAIVAVVVVGLGAYFGLSALNGAKKTVEDNGGGSSESSGGSSRGSSSGSSSQKSTAGSGETITFGEYSATTPEGFKSEEVQAEHDTVEMKSGTSLITISVHNDEKASYEATKESWLKSSDEWTTAGTKTFNGVEFVVMTEYDADDGYTYIDALTPIPGSNGYFRIMTHFKGNDTESFEKYVPAIIESMK